MHIVRLAVSITFILMLTWLSASVVVSAAELDPRLQAELVAAGSHSTIPIIIQFADRLDSETFRHLPKKERRQQLVQELRSHSGRSQQALRQLLRQAGISRFKDLWHINALAIEADPTQISAIASRPEVASVSLDGLVVLPPAQPAAPGAAEWNLAATGVLDLWPLLPGLPGDGMVVAAIDSGVDASHPNLQNWRGGPFDWFDPADPGNLSDTPIDTNGHGTAVMGVIAGGDIGGTRIGVAPGATWIAANTLSSGTAAISDLHASFAWALDPNGPLNPADIAPDVVNNSWALNASGICVTTFQADINLLKAAGIGVVFSAGNDGPELFTSQSPGNNPNVIAVGATDSADEIAFFSSRGSSPCDGGSVFPELVAPGVDIWTTFPGGYGIVSGTSFSAPHLSGVMLLLMQAYPAASISEIETAMTSSAEDLGPVGPDPAYGFGLVQAMSAWRYLALEPILSIHDPSRPENDHFLDFGPVAPETSVLKNLTLRNAGSVNLQIGSIDISGLTSEIVLESDLCSNTTLVSGQSCRVSLRFSPPDFASYAANLAIPSDDPIDPSVTVTLSGVGNTAPPAASLVAPRNGTINIARPVKFSWAQTADADGDSVSTALLVSETQDFSQSTPIVVTAVPDSGNSILYAGCGLFVFFTALLRRKHGRLLLTAIAMLLLLSCGGGGSGGIAGELISYNHAGLNAFTSYYWKIQSTDARGAMSESVVYHFTTGF